MITNKTLRPIATHTTEAYKKTYEIVASYHAQEVGPTGASLTNQALKQARDTDWSRQTIRMRAEAGDPYKKTW